MKYKSTSFGSVAFSLLLTACSRTIPNTSKPLTNTCFLEEIEVPVQPRYLNIKTLLDDFEQSKQQYDAIVLRVRGGNPLKYWRIQLTDQRMVFCGGEENQKPHYTQRSGYHDAELLLDRISAGYYTATFRPDFYSSEPGAELIIIKRNGATVFSYYLGMDCLDNLSAQDEVKIAKARALVAYIIKLK